MKYFTGYEYLLIDAAGKYGLDKLTFEERINWSMTNLHSLDDPAFYASGDAKERPLYLKTVMAIRKAQQGIPTGHLIGLDAVCSGVQVMSVLTGCIAGGRATGLVDPGVRADAYTEVTDAMSRLLTAAGGTAVVIDREHAKKSTMTAFYGSVLVPQRIFGANTPEINAFYAACNQVAPGPWQLLQVLLASWNPRALFHAWQLPDGYNAVVKVIKESDVRVEVDELVDPETGNHATFTYEFHENVPVKKGKSNAANLVHSVDAYILRSMHRRLNYHLDETREALAFIKQELGLRANGKVMPRQTLVGHMAYYVDQYFRSTVVDVVIAKHLSSITTQLLTTRHLEDLQRILEGMLAHPPFDLVTIHDEFRCHANHANQMRWMYREILAELAESELLDDLLTQLHGRKQLFPKQPGLARLIRQSNYAIC